MCGVSELVSFMFATTIIPRSRAGLLFYRAEPLRHAIECSSQPARVPGAGEKESKE